jgi:riboflavin synthase alpha subunit
MKSKIFVTGISVTLARMDCDNVDIVFITSTQTQARLSYAAEVDKLQSTK